MWTLPEWACKTREEAKKDQGKRRCFDCVLIDASCGRVLHHLPAFNRQGNYVRCLRLQAVDLA